MLTAQQRHALEIVRAHPGIKPREFARLMWPDSEGHEHHTKCGTKGVHKGGGMYLAAGGYLGRLRKAGLLVVSIGRYNSASEYTLSRTGRELLAAEEGQTP